MSNHLIIGLGGTGGKVIRNIRTAIYRDWRRSSLDVASNRADTNIDKVAQATPPGLKLDYLYVDSSREHMGFDNAEWKVLGENLQLNPASQLHLKGSDLKTRLDDVLGYPALAPWIGNPRDWAPILNLGGGGAEILGGQKRRLGRLLFASNASEFMDRVNQKANGLKRGAEMTSVTFHVVCGLAGGTGSGSLLDAISLIRNEYRSSENYPIILYLLLPDEHPAQNWNTGNYHANGFAALSELNALGVGSYMPRNLLGHGERFESLESPFKICYLITNENSHGAPFDVDKQIPELMAEMLYQKIVAGLHGVSKQLGRIVEWENMEISHEAKSSATGGGRCRLFASFGIKKISYPEEIIREYIGYSLSAQTLKQMLYNNWAQGYLREPGDFAVEGFVSDSTIQRELNLDREVFLLERQFSPEELEKDQRNWKNCENEWRIYIEKLAQDLVIAEDNPLETLKRRCEDKEKANFREGRGIVEYYAWKRDRIPEYARMIASGIESRLASNLIAGERSLSEIEAILKSLCKLLDRKRGEWDAQSASDSTAAARERVGWSENLSRYNDLGPLAKMIPGNKERIFEVGRDGMIRYFGLKTQQAAWNFASDFIVRVKEELQRTLDHVTKTIGRFENAVQFCEARASEHRPEEATMQSTEVVMRLFNGDEVTRFVDALISNRDFQDMQARQARTTMVDRMMAGRVGLRNLPDGGENLMDILAQSSHGTLSTFDASAEKASGFGRLLSVSIIDKLRERYSGDVDRMKKEIRDYMAKAGYLLRINEAEHAKAGPGTDFANQNKKTNVIVLMPDADSEDDFIKQLRDAFSSATSDSNTVQFIDTKDSRRHEITILSFVQLFPLRYLDVLAKLREKYRGRLKEGNSAQRMLEIHTDGSGDDYPALYVPPVRDVAGPALLAGIVVGSVRPKSSGDGRGTIRDTLVLIDSDDIPQTDLGSGFEGALVKCGTREWLDALSFQNSERVARLRKAGQDPEDLKGKVKQLAKDFAGQDDDKLRDLMGHANAACRELESMFNGKH